MSPLPIRKPSHRLAAHLVVLFAGAVIFSGCVAIKSQSASQRAPGVVTLNLQVCTSDRGTNAAACLPGTNTQENDNGAAVSTSAADGQLLVGFRVPDGTTAPQSFLNSDGRLNFAHSPGYTAGLTAEYVPIAGFHWVGYLSTQFSFNPADPSLRLTTINPEFVLPPGAGGGPFTGPFRWRAVVGARSISAGFPANSPVTCAVGNSFCFDSPTLSTTTGRASLPSAADYTATVSDFAVRTPAAATAGQGQVATLTFPLTSADARNLGAPTLSLNASTTIPGSQPQLGATTIAIPRNGETTATVAVPVPPGTPIGSYNVTLSATGNSVPAGAGIVRSATATLEVVDVIAPTVRIGTPADGATFTLGDSVRADYECADEAGGSRVATCAGPVAPGAVIDTSTPGDKTFTVNATDGAGNTATLTRTYRVASRPVVVSSAPPPRINFTLAFDFSASARGTTMSRLQVKGAPSGATVEVACKGRSCPTRRVKGKRQAVSFTKRNAGATVSLTPWVRKRLAPKTVLTVTVTKPGSFGMVKRLTIRANKRPVIGTTCLRPGSKTARASCQG